MGLVARHVAMHGMSLVVAGGACGEPAGRAGAPSPRQIADPQPAGAKPVTGPADPVAEDGGLAADAGVDVSLQLIRVGALNDETGPAAAIGKPFAIGKRILAEQVNAGQSTILPEGWRIELVERDHGYEPARAVAAYKEIEKSVLFLGTVLGTPNLLPLRPLLERDGMVAFPASLSSEMTKHAHTPPLGPTYDIEARRAMDWTIERAGAAGKVKAGIVYQKDEYGHDGRDAWRAAAELHGVTIVSERPVAPGQKDFGDDVAELQRKGAGTVFLATLPGATGGVLVEAGELGYEPTWIGNTPAWSDGFFDPGVMAPSLLASYYWSTGLAYWGEDVPGMDKFLAAYEKYGRHRAAPDFYILASYTQGLAQLEAAKRAIESGDITRAGYRKALRSIDDFDAGGITQPANLSSVPYQLSGKARILKPKLAGRTWERVSGYAAPSGG